MASFHLRDAWIEKCVCVHLGLSPVAEKDASFFFLLYLPSIFVFLMDLSLTKIQVFSVKKSPVVLCHSNGIVLADSSCNVSLFNLPCSPNKYIMTSNPKLSFTERNKQTPCPTLPHLHAD